VGTLVDLLTFQSVFQLFDKWVSQDLLLSKVARISSHGRERHSDDSSDSDDSKGRTRSTMYHFCQPGKLFVDSRPVKVFLAAVASVWGPNIYGINLYNLPQVNGFSTCDLLQIKDKFPKAILERYSIDSAKLTPVCDWDGFDEMIHHSFSHQKNRIGMLMKVYHGSEGQIYFDAFSKLVSSTLTSEVNTAYREHILAPCDLCSKDRGKNYLDCIICKIKMVRTQCGPVFSKLHERVGISDLRRLRNPQEFSKDEGRTLWLNDEIVNSYTELLARK
jgi:hypothetical protein